MTDEIHDAGEGRSSDENKSEESISNLYDQPDGNDWLLAHLVGLSNKFGLEYGITLNVSGLLVAGTLISGYQYIEELAKEIRGEEPEGSLRASVANNVATLGQIYTPPTADGEQTVSSTPRFVHLRNARFFSPSGHRIPTHGALWRGRMSSVDGVTLGELGAE